MAASVSVVAVPHQEVDSFFDSWTQTALLEPFFSSPFTRSLLRRKEMLDNFFFQRDSLTRKENLIMTAPHHCGYSMTTTATWTTNTDGLVCLGKSKTSKSSLWSWRFITTSFWVMMTVFLVFGWWNKTKKTSKSSKNGQSERTLLI